MESGAFLSSDGLTLLFSTNRKRPRGAGDLYFATRASVDAPFGKPAEIGAAFRTGAGEAGPWLAESGNVRFFYSDRPGGLGKDDIWFSRRIRKELK